MSPKTGACLCGAVRYRITGPLRAVVACHCTQCRRTTGHFMAATAARRRDFKLLSQAELCWYVSSPEARRRRAAECARALHRGDSRALIRPIALRPPAACGGRGSRRGSRPSR